MAPSEHERATAWVTPALVMANTNAVSRQPEETTSELSIRTLSSVLDLELPIFAPNWKYLETKPLNVYKRFHYILPKIVQILPGERDKEWLTPVDNFAKNCWAVGGRAVPAAVAELPLALLYGSVQPSGDGMQDARILPNQPTLATTQ